MKPHLRYGVTILEILAVVCLIAIIAAIMFPVFQKVHEGSRPSCQSNLKQLGLAYVQYTQDYDEKYPQGVNAAGNGWAGKIYPYVKTTGIYRCPDESADKPAVSYAQSQALTGRPLTALAAPIDTVELYEFTTPNCDPSTPEAVSATGLSASQNSTRHDPQTFALNFLAADGHVKRLTPTQVSSGLGALPTRKITRNGPALLTFSVK